MTNQKIKKRKKNATKHLSSGYDYFSVCWFIVFLILKEKKKRTFVFFNK